MKKLLFLLLPIISCFADESDYDDLLPESVPVESSINIESMATASQVIKLATKPKNNLTTSYSIYEYKVNINYATFMLMSSGLKIDMALFNNNQPVIYLAPLSIAQLNNIQQYLKMFILTPPISGSISGAGLIFKNKNPKTGQVITNINALYQESSDVVNMSLNYSYQTTVYNKLASLSLSANAQDIADKNYILVTKGQQNDMLFGQIILFNFKSNNLN